MPFTANPVTITFDRQDSGNSTFTLRPAAASGPTWPADAGTDIVSHRGRPCGPASATFPAVVPPGKPAITSFTSEPTVGCSPAQIVVSWTTINSTGVFSDQIPSLFTLPPNGSFPVTITSATTFLLTAYGTTPGQTAQASLTVPVDFVKYYPILDKNNLIVAPSSVTLINVTGVPDPTLLRRVYVQNQSGSFFVGTGVPGQFSYLAGPFRARTTSASSTRTAAAPRTPSLPPFSSVGFLFFFLGIFFE